MIMGGNDEFQQTIVAELRKRYPFKHWFQKEGTFLGKKLEQKENGDIWISQKEYAQQVHGMKLSSERKKDKNEPTTNEEKQQMRAVLGAINWLVSGSRPDLAAACSLMQQRVTKSVVADLIDLVGVSGSSVVGADHQDQAHFN